MRTPALIPLFTVLLTMGCGNSENTTAETSPKNHVNSVNLEDKKNTSPVQTPTETRKTGDTDTKPPKTKGEGNKLHPMAVKPTAIELKPVTVTELDEFLAKQKGKVVLVDCWFLGCAPCVKRFPDFVQFHKAYAKKGLVCVSLDTYMNDWKERADVEAFLKKQEADFANFIFKDVERTVDDWQDKNDANATPNYLVWDRKGNRVKIPGKQTHEVMDKLLAELLEEK